MGDEKADITAPSDHGAFISGRAGNSDEALKIKMSTLINEIALVVT